ncbi:outer membrane beta-barrel protein [Larsenimonas suaedae]|uniref:Outer membrane beta-barrel protein n=1 Tax=Larsenimonas suaedae TaxID=1851019 RepID=A0ABU1GT84_9GAMM|nr:outer membrane beta-barrel protein [Larsenimonas suaedae]MCM2971677.1 outer membrane beta-barrel protein [Larsenimonas suaedae]MDR5895229.1 outer membrane beta-barrel protein [Larsenimonas suaedae]
MNRIALMTAPLLIGSAFVTTTAMAADTNTATSEGIYSGVGVGETRVHDGNLHAFSNDNAGTASLSDDDDTAQNAFVGYKYNPYFSTELSFTDLGDIEAQGNGSDATLSTKAYGLSAIGEVPIYGGLSGYGRVGYAYFKTDGDGNYANGDSVDNEYGGAPMYGLGAKYQFSDVPVFVRAEYTRYQLDSNYKLDTAMGSVGVQF